MARIFGRDSLRLRARLLGAEVLAAGGMCAVVWVAGVVAGIDKKGNR